MKIILIVLLMISLFITPVFAYKDTLLLPNGKKLTLKRLGRDWEPYSVLLDGKPIYKGSDQVMFLEKAFLLSNGVAVIVEEACGGNACESYPHYFLTVYHDNKVKVSKDIGGKVVKSEQKGDTVTLLVAENLLRKIYKQIIYKDGQITKLKTIDNWTGKKGKVLPVSEIFKMVGKYPYEILSDLNVKTTIMDKLKINENIYNEFDKRVTFTSPSTINGSTLVLKGSIKYTSTAGILQVSKNGDISMFFYDEDKKGFYYTNSPKHASSIDEISAENFYSTMVQGKMNVQHNYLNNVKNIVLLIDKGTRSQNEVFTTPGIPTQTAKKDTLPPSVTTKQRKASPDLLISSISFSEPSGNGALDAGEKGSIIVKAKNNGKGEALGVALLIETIDAKGNASSINGMNFRSKLHIGTIESGEEKTFSIDITASEDIPTSGVIIKATLSEEGGFDSQPVAISFKTKELVPPLLQVAKVEIQDVDGKRIITKGKEINIALTIQNAGIGVARDIVATIESQNKEIVLFGENQFKIGSISPGASSKANFTINVTRRYSGSNTLPIFFRIDEKQERFSVKPNIELVINEEAPEIKIVKIEAKETPLPIIKTETDQTNINVVPKFTKDEKVFGPNDVAVVIGIEQYRKNLPKSEYSYNDAKLIKNYLEAMGFSPRNTEYLLNENATRTDIQKTIERWLPNRSKKESKVFIYYSGHGAPDPKTGEAYIVPYDGDPEYISDTGYSLKKLYENLRKLEVNEIIVALDTCFSGMGGRSVLAKGVRPAVITLKTNAPPQNTVVLSATQGEQISTSSPDKEHGLFTYYFLKAIKEGKKSIPDVYEYIKPRVEDEAKRLNVSQSPAIYPDTGSLHGGFALVK
ncbi:MAG: caspase family protein [Proteobacteria bacterium]|nr:caspase family protein [Pseudomonadota bacterium]